MPKYRQTTQERLYKIAATQQGFFTAKQAVAAGIQDAAHPFHVRHGNWTREYRGIYRLARYPRSDDAEYALWSLWSRNREGIPQGVYSHQTALSLFELSDVNPSKIHLAVPKTFRRHSRIPGILVLHRTVIPASDTQEREGYRVTRPLRTLKDLVQEGTESPEIIEQAIVESVNRGYINRNEAKTLRRNLRSFKSSQ